jgi:hypothetical protein
MPLNHHQHDRMLSSTKRLRLGATALTLLAGAAGAHAQCFEWSEQFAVAGTTAQISDTVIWDDGTGPALYAVGSFPNREIGRIASFTLPGGSLATGALHIARWDGRNWNIVGNTVYSPFDPQWAVTRLNTIQVFDPDGPGPQTSVLVVGGQPNNASSIRTTALQFDGTNWSTFGQNLGGGANEEIRDLEIFNGELYACGRFAPTSGLSGLAKWDPAISSWVDVGGGIPTSATNVRAERMAVGDAEGDGIDELYIAGTFTFSVTGGSAAKLVKWNGSNFSTVPGWVNTSTPNAANLGGPSLLKFMDIGDGPALFVGDAIYTGLTSPANIRGVSLARLKNGVWSTLLGQTASGTIKSYTYAADMFTGPEGLQLHIGGTRLLDGVSGQPLGVNLARRSAAGTWSALTLPVNPASNTGVVAWMRPLDWDASGPGGEKLLFGATQYRFGTIGVFNNLEPSGMALWNGTSVELAHSGAAPLSIIPVDFEEFDPDGAGPLPAALYMGHVSPIVAGVRQPSGVLSFDGTSFQSTPTGPFPVSALETFTPASGTTALYAAGLVVNSSDAGLYRFDGSAWTLVGSSFADEAIEVGPAAFDSIATATVAGEPSLILSGRFSQVNGVASRFVARFNGTTWFNMDAGLPAPSGDPNLLFRINNGPAQLVFSFAGQLYIITSYNNYDLTTFSSILGPTELYTWNGTSWQLLATPPGSLIPLDLGSGEELFSFGRFQDFGAPGVSYVAKWNGTSFEAVGDPISFANPNATASTVSNLGVFDFGSGPELVAVLNSEANTTSGPISGLIRLTDGQWQNVEGARQITGASAIFSSDNPVWGGLYIGAGSVRRVSGDILNNGGIESRGIAWLKPTLPCNTCPACPADFDNDGGVTGADVEAFFFAFESGDPCGDTDLDGGVTGADVEAFFIAFEAGGC